MIALEDRIQELMRETGWDATKIAGCARVSASAVSQWLGNGAKPIKSIGKIEAAIYLERESGFSALWLAKGVGPKRVIDRDSENAWPFPDLEYERFKALTPNQKIEVQAAVRERLERFEAERAAGKRPPPPALAA